MRRAGWIAATGQGRTVTEVGFGGAHRGLMTGGTGQAPPFANVWFEARRAVTMPLET